MRDNDRVQDFRALGFKLKQTIAALEDPESRTSGSDAASLARERRMFGLLPGVDLAGEVASDYDLLGDALGLCSGSGAASVVRERRMLRRLLNSLEPPTEVTKVASLESRRAARAEAAGTARRRRQPG